MASLRIRPRLILDHFAALLVGGRCAGCGRPSRLPLCSPCLDALVAVPPVEMAAFRDEGAIGRIVRRAKRGDWRAGGRLLAHLVARDRPALVPDCDAVTWVPPDRRRRARRGGHLPERFARGLGEALGCPALDLLEPSDARRRAQRGLDREARRRNALGAFRVRRRRDGHLPEGTRVLVVDDVRTTGATLAAARSALVDAGLEAVALAIVGVDSAVEAPDRCREVRSEREKMAHDPNHRCR